MIEFLKKKWLEWLISITIVIITVILTNAFTIKRETNTELQRKLEQKASIEYVNQQDQGIRLDMDRQNSTIQTSIKQADEAQLELIKSMDRKIDILLNRQK
jgi:threonyl-tRNA synthetase